MPDFQAFWRRRGLFNILLLPPAAVFAALSAVRRRLHTRRQRTRSALPPVIIVGNIVVGGSGKTPVVINLAEQLAAHGFRPGIISRGYGGRTRSSTLLVQDDTDWRDCGDEPLLIRRRTRLPVCVARKRRLAAKRLAQDGCDVLISDDGLQHYALPRTVEICVTDGNYRFGNGWRLPAGPLRESPARAEQCDFHLLVNGTPGDNTDKTITIKKTVRGISPLTEPYMLCPPDFAAGKNVAALAGIARPQDFFTAVEQYGITIRQKIMLPDHAHTALNRIDADIIIMSEKDAVKYSTTDKRLFILMIDCPLPRALVTSIRAHLHSGEQL